MTITKLKRAARARQTATGERYTEALARVKEELMSDQSVSVPSDQSVSVPRVIFAQVKAWLEARGFAAAYRGGMLYYNNAGHLNSIKYEAGDSYGFRGFICSFGDATTAVSSAVSLQWAENAEGTTDLLLFILETKLGSPPTVESLVEEKVKGMQMQLTEAELEAQRAHAEAKKAKEIARHLQTRLGEYEGTLTPDPWQEAANGKSVSIRLPLYSTLRLACHSEMSRTVHRLFITPLGMTGQGYTTRPLSKAETNMKEGGRVPGGIGCCVKLIMVELFGAPDDVEAVRKNVVLHWDFVQTRVEVAPLSMIIEPGQTRGVIGIGDQDKAAGTSRLIRVFGDEGVVLPKDTTFCMTADFGSEEHELQDDVEIRVILGAVPLQSITC
jgi:hypothetical protein